MNREELIAKLQTILRDHFEIDNPDLDANLRQQFGFDSVDAVELLAHVELLVGRRLTQQEKLEFVSATSLGQVADRVEKLISAPAA